MFEPMSRPIRFERRSVPLFVWCLAAVLLGSVGHSPRALAEPSNGKIDGKPDPGPDSPLPPESTQSAPESPAGGGAEVVPAAPELGGGPAAPAPVAPALSTRLDDIDQTARIAARRIENLEEQLATRAKEAPTIQADDKAFALKSADAAYTLRFYGLLQADSRWFINDGVLSDRADTFLIRRFRPGMGGTLFNFSDFRFTPDLAGGTAAVFDAYVDLHPFPELRLRVGKFKPPLGLERLQGDASLEFLERALSQNLTPQRDVGASLWGDIAGGIVRYDLGIFNGATDNTNPDIDSNHAKDFVGRLLIQPFKTEALKSYGSLGVHFAVSTGNRLGTPTATQLPTFRSGGQQAIFSYLAPANADGVAFAHHRETRINPAIFYYFGSLGFLAEYVQAHQQIQKGNPITTLTNRAGHATLSYAFNALNSLEGAVPLTRFDPAKGTWGALEVALRVNYLKISDAAFDFQLASETASIRRAVAEAVALTWIPSLTTRLAVSYELTSFKGGAATPDKKVADRKTEHVIITRAQVNF